MTSCDCSQRVNIIVIDSNTGYEIDSVKIWKTSRPNDIRFTNIYGFMEFSSISDGLMKCPDIQLNFQKNDYKLLIKEFKSYLKDTIIVTLEKDFDFSNIRNDILDSLVLIEKINGISSGIVGYGGETPKQWYTRQWILKNATESEMISMIDYPNNAIKAIAFEGLYKYGYNDIYRVLNKIIDFNNRVLYYQQGCEGDVIDLAEYCYSNIMHYQLPGQPPWKQDDEVKVKLTKEQISIILEKLKNK